MNNILLVFVGGGIGTLARFGISEIFRANFRSGFPFATLCSNIISCIILALVIMGPLSYKAEPGIRNLLIVGICGGFSTFSTFSFETVELIRAGNMMMAVANILINVTVCVALIWFITRAS